MGAYLRGQSLVCLVIGVLAFVLYRAMGLPHAGMLGLVYSLGEAVPVVGPIIGTATAAIAALVVQPSLVAWVVVGLTGCAIGPNYVRPQETPPSHYKAEALGSWKEGRPLDHVPKGTWWEVFADESLNELEQRAAASNQELKAAVARVMCVRR